MDRGFPQLFDLRTVRVIATLLAVVAVLGFIYLARRTLIVFIFAILFAYLLEPVIPHLQHWLHLSRGWAIAVLYLAFGVGLLLLVFYFGPMVMRQAEHMTTVLPGLSERVTSGQIARQIGEQRGWSYNTQMRLQHLLQDHRSMVISLEHQLTGYATALASNLVWLALIPILAVFFLKDGDEIRDALVDLAVKRNRREMMESILEDLHQVMARYILSQLLLTLLALGVFMIGFWLLRLPYPFVLATVAGLLEFIPVVGPLAGALMVGTVALLTGYQYWIPLILFLGTFRVVQDYVNSPHLMGGQVKLHPLAVLFGVLAGAELAGVLGVYLSIPAMASLRVLWRHWRAGET